MTTSPTKFVFWIASSTPTACQLLATNSGADVLLIDGQHGAFGPEEALRLVTACNTGKAECAVRISDHSAVAETCRYIDAGATTIICPMVNDRASCEQFVMSCYYPPMGNRSYGPYKHRLLFKDGFSPDKANARVIALVMIETKSAVLNLEEILSVPNLSGIFIGPNDLGLSLGFQPTSSPQGEVLKTLLHIGKRARELGKIAGIFCSDTETAKTMAKAGFNFVVYGNDLGFLMAGNTRALTELRS